MSAAESLAARLPPPTVAGRVPAEVAGRYPLVDVERLTGCGRSTLRAWCSPEGWLATDAVASGNGYWLSADGVRKILRQGGNGRTRSRIEDRAARVLADMAHLLGELQPGREWQPSDRAAGPDAAAAVGADALRVETQRLQAQLDGAKARIGQLLDEVARWKRIARRNDAAMLKQRANWLEFDDTDTGTGTEMEAEEADGFRDGGGRRR